MQSWLFYYTIILIFMQFLRQNKNHLWSIKQHNINYATVHRILWDAFILRYFFFIQFLKHFLSNDGLNA